MTEPCKHESLTCYTETARGARIDIAVVRCFYCGTAVGAFLPQIPEALETIGKKLDALQSEVQKLSS